MKTRFIAAVTALVLLFCLTPIALGTETNAGSCWQSVLYQGEELHDVRNIVPTATGYWVCTKAGLYFVGNSGQVELMFSDILADRTMFVYDIAVDGNGDYYVTQGFTYAGGVNYGLLHISSDGELLQEYTAENSGLPDNFVQAVEVDAQGRVWIGSGTALSCFNPSDNSWKVLTSADGLPADAVNTLVQDGKGGMWISCYPLAAGDGGSAPFSGGYAHMDAGGNITSWYYSENEYPELNGYLLGDFWARGIALDSTDGAYIVRSGGAAAYFASPNYLGADGKPIPITDCVGGRLDYISAGLNTVRHYTGRALSPIIDRSIVATDFVHGVDGLTPEIRVVAVDAKGGVWLGTSGAGLLAADTVNGTYTVYSSSNGDFPNAFFNNVWALAALKDGTVIAGSQGGLRLLPAAAEPGPLTISASTHQVEIDGQAVQLAAYNINGNNYFKLRDLAYALNGGAKQFAVSFDAATLSINLIPGEAYTAVGGELAAVAAANELEVGESTHSLLLNQQPATARAYHINGNNYFLLRDIGRLLDFSVTWDAERQAVCIDTARGYNPAE